MSQFFEGMFNLEPKLFWQRCLISSKPNRVLWCLVQCPPSMCRQILAKFHLQQLAPGKQLSKSSSKTSPVKSTPIYSPTPPALPACLVGSLQVKNSSQGVQNPCSCTVPLTDVLQQLEIQLPDCKSSSVPFGIVI